ncbi:MAG: hypothetical protein KA714_30470 [Limnoraphis sp. WC205]|nr:hypothetical protein [Limnoraphis sp. WC205]
MAKLGISSLEMSQDEEDWLRVIANLNGDTMKSILTHSWRGHLASRKQHYVRKIDYLARSLGVSWETAYILLLQKNQPFSEADIEWAKSQDPLAIKDQELSCDYFRQNHPPKQEQKIDDDRK